jgi:hypothetical protein
MNHQNMQVAAFAEDGWPNRDENYSLALKKWGSESR